MTRDAYANASPPYKPFHSFFGVAAAQCILRRLARQYSGQALGGQLVHEYWLNDSRSLKEISGLVAVEFGADFEGDSENVYEWFEGANAALDLKFNVSRKHVEDRTEASNPVRISVSGSAYPRLGVDALGIRLATCLGASIKFGNVVYLGGDEFRFDQVRGYDPET